MEKSNTADAPLEEILSTFWDLVIFGTGYAGFAAALAGRAAGKKVLLIDPACDLLWESARARNPTLGHYPLEMASFVRSVGIATGVADDWIDPGAAEWIANEILIEKKIPRLYYATPVAAEISKDKIIQSVTLALRDRLVSISAAQYIDTTEYALLTRLCGHKTPTPKPIKRILRVYLQRTRWTVKIPFDFNTGVFGIRATLEASGYSSEKVMKIEVGGSFSGTVNSLYIPTLKALKSRLGAKASDPLISHWSIDPYPIYARTATPSQSPCTNLSLAVPALSVGLFDTLADRFSLGLQAFSRLTHAKKAKKQSLPIKNGLLPTPVKTLSCDLFIAGLGTGGLPATVAAARAGAKVIAADSLSTPGGIPTNGGIHAYYYGCPGGLQTEIDAAVIKAMPNFSNKDQCQGYHPFARTIVSDEFLEKAKVSTLYGATIIPGTVKVEDGKITSLLIVSQEGIIEVAAKAWIDSTGDGTLSRYAGVPATMGRDGDGSLHAFSQSWGAFGLFQNGLKLFITNFDHGFVDPTDSVDMTYARIESIHKLVKNSSVHSSNSFNRTTGVYPYLGLRQGPIVKTSYQLTMDDLISHKKFDHAIGFTGGHIDIHSTDFFQESNDLAFYNWGCKNWSVQTAAEIPYEAIIPEEIKNLWIACRAAGATQDASNAFRMQRDIQRIGEAAGLAASIAIKQKVDNDKIPFNTLRTALLLSGALTAPTEKNAFFGSATTNISGDPILTQPATAANIKKWYTLLDGEKAGVAMWRLYRLGKEKVSEKLKEIVSANNAKSFNAALILAALGESDANAFLQKVIDNAAPSEQAFCKVDTYTSAAWAIGISGTKSAFKPLAALASNTTLNPIGRLAALWSLGSIAARNKTLKVPEKALLQDALDGTKDITIPERPWERAFVSERLRRHSSLPSSEADLQELATSPWRLVRNSIQKLP